MNKIAGLLCLLGLARAEVQNVEAVDAPVLPNPFVHLKVGDGWTKFKFGSANTTVYSQFLFNLTHNAVLKLTDYFCSGDRFNLYDNGVFIGMSSETVFDNCTSTTCDPNYAYENEPWSKFTYPLSAGSHNITLRVITSPYNEGYAAIRVDPNYMKCCLSLSGLTLVDTPVGYSCAEDACHAYGLKLADIDIYNFNEATQVVFGCAGAFSSAYIKSYWGNNYQSSCLALYTGNAAPGGAVSTPVDCSKRMPVLCQGETKSCHRHHFLRA